MIPGHCPRILKHNVKVCASDYACLVTEGYMDVLELGICLAVACMQALTYLKTIDWILFNSNLKVGIRA